MADQQEKRDAPPYASYSSFRNFINSLKETGVPARIDRSVLSKMSGSSQFAVMATLKWLRLTDDEGLPSPQLEAMVKADDKQYKTILKDLLADAYSFITANGLDLTKATSAQVEKAFRDLGIQGATVTKSIAFFLNACKDAEVKVSPHVKAPTISRPSSSKKAKKPPATPPDATPQHHDHVKPGMIKITIPLFGMDDGTITLPEGLDDEQWEYVKTMAALILKNYRKGKGDGSDLV